MSSTAFLTTVFPKNKNFLKSFFNSLSTQTYKDFDLVIVNDSFKNLNYYKDLYSNLNIININSSDTPAKNREIGINYCIDQKYEVLIFGDSDDYFQNNRVEKSLELLKKVDVVVNDLSLFNNKGIYEKKYLSNRLKNLDVVDLEFIKDKNIFGMSNTAVKLQKIKKVSFNEKTIAVDWYFFRSILKKGLKAIFTNETESFYRQHENNTIGLHVQNNKYYLWWEK
jgi:hypothetical protein